MARRRRELTPTQVRVLGLLAAGVSEEQAATNTGLSLSTIRRWLRTELFKSEIRHYLERYRQAFEGRIFQIANEGAREIQVAIRDNPDIKADPIEKMFAAKRRLKGAEIAVSAASRILTRYKELQIDDRRPAPMFLIPEGTEMLIDRVEPVAPSDAIITTTAVPINEDGTPKESPPPEKPE
jgi:DNA-binding CsgD family transcriptional regulator